MCSGTSTWPRLLGVQLCDFHLQFRPVHAMFWYWVVFVGSADVNRQHKSPKEKLQNQNLQRETEKTKLLKGTTKQKTTKENRKIKHSKGPQHENLQRCTCTFTGRGNFVRGQLAGKIRCEERWRNFPSEVLPIVPSRGTVHKAVAVHKVLTRTAAFRWRS